MFVVCCTCFRCSVNTDSSWKSDTQLSAVAAPSDSSQLKNVGFRFLGFWLGGWFFFSFI